MSWTRRNFLYTASTSGIAAIAGAAAEAPARAADEFDTLRAKWLTIIYGSGFAPGVEPFASRLAEIGAEAANSAATMAPTSTSLWPDLPLGTKSTNITASMRRLREMAEAYLQPATGHTGDIALAASVSAGLDHLTTISYTATASTYDNWWDWQIGAPQAFLDTIAAIHDRLTSAQLTAYHAVVDHFVTDANVAPDNPAVLAANRVDMCRVVALRGVLGKSAPKIATARTGLSPVFPFVTTGDGFYVDGSFNQHTWVPYHGGYGAVLLGGVAKLLALLAGSTWAIADPAQQNIFTSVDKGFAPFIFNGLMMDGQSGRGISRGLRPGDLAEVQDDDHKRGHGIIANILLLASAASPPDAARWRAMAKGWLQRDFYLPPLANPVATISSLALFSQVLSDGSVTSSPESTGHRLFGANDRSVHRRPSWAATVSMCSARTTYYETGNGENLHGWHTNAGMTYRWGDTYSNGQFSDAFWPTVDPYRLPGTTVSRITLANAAGGTWNKTRPTANWAGGATDGEYAAVGQDLQGLLSTLRAKKSWFFVDDAVICLGAGITASDGVTVETTVENRNLGGTTGTRTFIVNGVTKPTTIGWNEVMSGVTWAYLKDSAGFVFPGGATVNARREQRTGKWRDINTSGSTDPINRYYLTMWTDHGVNPVNSTYAHIIMPGATSTATAARAADTGWLNIIANTGSVQSVAVPSGGLTAANFFSAGTAGALTVNQGASVLIRQTGNTATVCVSEPRHLGTTVTLTWERPVAAVTSADPSVTVVETGARLRLSIAVGGKAGATQRAIVTLA